MKDLISENNPRNTKRDIWRYLVVGVMFMSTLAVILFFMRQDPFLIFRDAARGSIIWGATVYFLLEVASIVVVPVATIFLVPVAVDVFGPLFTSILNILGWGAGSAVAFLIARHAARPLLEYFISMEKVSKYRNYISESAEFWTVVAMRVIMPVDILSYALGVFSKISFSKYMLATLLGISPFAFIYSYTGDALISGRYVAAAIIAIFGVSLFLYVGKHLLKAGKNGNKP